MQSPVRRVVILGAAGRDFHDFNTVCRDEPGHQVVAFTATQIPGIEGRRYPAALAGSLYPDGIPIVAEDGLEELIRREKIDLCVDSPKTVAIARTMTPNTDTGTGGAFGVAYPAAAKGGGARASALVPGLTRDASVRSNLAVVHLGGGSEIALSLSVRLYDAATSQAVGNPITVTLQPGDWPQWSGVFDTAGVPAGTTTAYAVITRLTGDDTWLAYGILNDAKTSDGSVLRMFPGAEY